MTTKRLFLTTTIVSLFLLGFVGNRSEAFEIQEMGTNGVHIYVETDDPYLSVVWSINDVYEDTSWGDGNEPVATLRLPSLSGSLQGTTYEIEALAESWPDGQDSHSRSYTITVYQSITNSGWGSEDDAADNADVWGSVSINRHYYSSPSVFAYFSTNAYSNEMEFRALARRQHTVYADAAKNIRILGGDAHDRSHDVAIGQRLGNLASMTEYVISHSLQGRAEQTYWADTYHRLKVEGINHRFISSDISFKRKE